MSPYGEEIDYTLAINTELVENDLRRIETILFRLLSYVKRMSGGNEDIERFISMLQKAITWIRTLQLAMRALELASGPIGWAYAAISVVGLAFTTVDALYDQGRGMG